jgi:outer membrane murein-binding lipoprotein Lpp
MTLFHNAKINDLRSRVAELENKVLELIMTLQAVRADHSHQLTIIHQQIERLKERASYNETQ